MGTPLGNAVNLSAILGSGKAIKSRIHRIGVELEGGWVTVPKGARIVHDGSVRNMTRPDLESIGELPSPILEPSNVEKWVRTYYPHEVNNTCGMHVHISFEDPINYMRCMRSDFPATVIACFKDWAGQMGLPKAHPLWERVSGNSRYCQHVYQADKQASSGRKDFDQTRDGHRYTVVNYCYARNGTMEIRLLPMMENADLAVKAIDHAIKITNAFLLATAKRERQTVAAIPHETDSDIKVYRLRA